MKILDEIWHFPITLLAWAVFHLIVFTKGKVKWINAIGLWLELSDEIVDELLKDK